MRPVSNRKACDSPSRQIYHAQQEIRDHISMPTQNQIQVSQGDEGQNEIIMCPGVMYPIQIVNTQCALFAWYCYHVYHVINWLLYAILHVYYYTASALTSGLLQHKHYVLQDCHLLDYYDLEQPLLCVAEECIWKIRLYKTSSHFDK